MSAAELFLEIDLTSSIVDSCLSQHELIDFHHNGSIVVTIEHLMVPHHGAKPWSVEGSRLPSAPLNLRLQSLLDRHFFDLSDMQRFLSLDFV
jgi:hypothetical protein